MIGQDKDFFVIRLNSGLYDKAVVKDAFDALKPQADAELEEGEYFVIKIRKNRDAESVGYEFINYVLKLMKSKGVV